MSYILIFHKDDLEFVRNAQGTTVNNVRLPSGFSVPKAPPGKNWIVCKNRIILK